MPQLTDRTKLPNIVDPVIKDTMDPKHLYQVCDPGIQNSKLISHFPYYIPNDAASTRYFP